MRRRWVPSESSYTVVEWAIPLLKLLGGLVIALGLLTAFRVVIDGDLSGDTRVFGALLALVVGTVQGIVLMAAGGALDIHLGIDSVVRGAGDEDPALGPAEPSAAPRRGGDWASGGDERGWY